MFHETQGWRVGSIFGVDVSISFGYIFLIGWISLMGLRGGQVGFAAGLATSAMITLSVLIHELGHALVSKYYRLKPSILLHGFGGVCIHDEASSDGRDALIVLAGPLLQIFVGLLGLGLAAVVDIPGRLADVWQVFIGVSLIWGAVNLVLPLWPLDGGKLFHLLLRRFVSADTARRVTLRVSMVVAVVVGVLGLTSGSFFIGFIALFILMDNWSALQADSPLVSRAGKAARARTQGAARELLDEAEAAFAAQNWRDAARLCHQARATRATMSHEDNARVWELLALCAIEQGELDEARDYLRHAPRTAAIEAARKRLESW
jgi:Zn-dependent protease